MNIFVTAIGTDSGKTLASAILVEALKADYWKPVQAGLEETDRDAVQSLISNDKTVIHPEAYALKEPMSPHASAEREGVVVELDKIELPSTENHLVIEGAGGILVPLNDEDYVIDIAQKYDLETILVSNLYLGSINHTLLSINELKRRGVKLKGIIFNGPSNPDSERIILKEAGCPCLLRIAQEDEVNKEVVKSYASILSNELKGIAL